MELERKFLIEKMPPEVLRVKPVYIRQGYIVRSNEKEVRIRQRGRKYSLTIKSIGNLSREESETQISRKIFKDLWPSTKGARVEKERRTISSDNAKLEIDNYLGSLEGLMTGETEFKNLEEARDFTPPSFFTEELTFDCRFKNKNLSILSSLELETLVSLKEPGNYPLIGVIPYTRKKEELHLILITTRTSGTWIFPKGQPMSGKINEEVALIEAYEEAGIKGKITGNPIVVPYEKSNGRTSMILYPMRVTKISRDWPESSQRVRKIMKPKEAVKKIEQPGLVAALEFIASIGLN